MDSVEVYAGLKSYRAMLIEILMVFLSVDNWNVRESSRWKSVSDGTFRVWGLTFWAKNAGSFKTV